MASQAEVENFVNGLFGGPEADVTVTARAAARLRGFDFRWLDELPDRDRTEIADRFRDGLVENAISEDEGGGGAVALPIPVSIGDTDVDAAIRSLAQMIRDRGLDGFSPRTQAMLLKCDCWPFPLTRGGGSDAVP
jgi:hypothetical protein